MTGRTSLAVAGFFQGIPRILQAFANGAFGGLRTVFDGFACSFCTMLNRLPRFGRGFLYSLAGLFDWTLILSAQNQWSANG
jgi:hypothetical protein